MVTFDFTASMAAIAGVQPAEDKPFDGIDIIAHVAQKKPDFDRTLYWRKPRGTSLWKAVRQGNFKYISYRKGNSIRKCCMIY